LPTRRDIDDFLAQQRIAFVGVSRDPKQFANAVYRAFKSRGYQVYPVNPHAEQLEGDRCYPTVAALPAAVDGALVMLPPAQVAQVMRQCTEAGIRRIWLRGSADEADVAEEVRHCRVQGISVVDGACPMMFAEPVGFGHACHRFVMQLTGSLPK
jgi:predicted CoA-binding protein